MVEPANLSAPRRTRLGVFVLVAALHVLAILGLIRAFAPDFTAEIVERTLSSFTVTVSTPPPTPVPSPQPSPTAREGAAAEAGRKARPKEEMAQKPKLVLAEKPAPRASASGDDTISGARETGAGTGAGGQGGGTGSGNSGSGQGGATAAKPVKIAGEINSARDYPAASRNLRLGDFVIVHMTVGTDGRAHNCRVQRPSRDPAADAITCRLAEQRFRFKPAVDAAGKAVESTYGWRQRWFL